eukprot:6190723-Pleurochrysis_carterae.AAC.4
MSTDLLLICLVESIASFALWPCGSTQTKNLLTSPSSVPPPRHQPGITTGFGVHSSTRATLSMTVAPSADTVIKRFTFERAWYPVMPISYAETDRPNAFTLLGRRMVLWRSADGWACVEDACPHRLAPLSTGRVKSDGNLMCRFHGWEFAGDGKCAKIPNASPEASASLCGSPETAATRFPVRDDGGLLWVWPESGDAGFANSLLSSPAVDPNASKFEWIMTIPPVSYESMVENSMDPSHAPHLHEGTFAASEMVRLEEYEVASDIEPQGYLLKHGGYTQKNVGMDASRRFTAPSFVHVEYKLPSGKKQDFQLYFTPSTPFETRVMTNLQAPQLPAWLPARGLLTDLFHAFFLTRKGLWRFSDQDRLVMQGQDQTQSEDPHRAQLAWDIVSPSDTGVSTFRRWLERVGGGPFSASNPTFVPTKEGENRWNVHGKHCPSCRRTLKLVDRLQKQFGKLSAASAAVAAVLAIRGALSRAIIATAISILMQGASMSMERGRRSFFGLERELWVPQVYAK